MDKFTFDKVVGLAHLLEKYIPKLPADDKHTLEIAAEDRQAWNTYFQELILTNVIDDGKAFGQKDNNTPYGIGNDASGFRVEYYQLLIQCYRYLYQALSAGEVFLKFDHWRLADRLTAVLPTQYSPVIQNQESNNGV